MYGDDGYWGAHDRPISLLEIAAWVPLALILLACTTWTGRAIGGALLFAVGWMIGAGLS